MTPSAAKWAAQDAQAGQVLDAVGHLESLGGMVGYPFHGWYELAGTIQPGEVDFLAAASGQGKTTAVRSIIERLVSDNIGVIYGGFEVAPEAHRVGFAAMLAGIDPGDVLSGDWNTWEPAILAHARGKVRAQLAAMKGPPWDALHIVPHDHVTPRAVHDIGDLALTFEAEYPRGVVCIVDHVDHLGAAGAKSYGASVEVTSAIHDHAKRHGTRWLVTTQVHNRTAGAGGDKFWRHRPIPVMALKNGQHKEEIATRIFGVYRPLKTGVTVDELKAVSEGRSEMRTVLADGVSCVDCMKHRHHGTKVGSRVLLGWEKGRLVDLPTPDALMVEAGKHGIRTNTNYVGG